MKEFAKEAMMGIRDNSKRKYETEMPATDDGWWESVLAEEQQHYTGSTKPRPAPEIKPVQKELNAAENLNSSDRQSIAPAKPGDRAELFHSLKKGAYVKGTVATITDFGAFVDLGGVEGLIHISELSWGRVSHPNQIVRLGEEIDVQVLDISTERSRVALSLKRMSQNPWEQAEVDFTINTIQPAVVSSVLSYGAFVRLKPGIEGLIHISKMPLGEGQTPQDILTEGQQVQVRVLYVDSIHHRMGLSLQTNH